MERTNEAWTEALDYYRRARDVRAELAAADPNNARWARNLAIAHAKMAQMLARSGEADDAVLAQGKAIDIFQALYDADPSDANALNDLTGAKENLKELTGTETF